MFTAITFPSALYFWLSYPNLLPLEKINPKSFRLNPDEFQLTQLLSEAANYHLPLPLHIMVPSAACRSHGNRFICHVAPKILPRGGLVQLSADTAIISPELCFLMAAQYLPLPELAVLGFDLCAMYYLDDKSEYGQTNRDPVTSVEKISRLLDDVNGISGIRSARMAGKYILNNSNSPVESRLAATAILPYMHGGVALPYPELNGEVLFNAAGRNYFHRDRCYCDMLWRKLHVAAEYDSDLAHLSRNKFYQDKNRSTALQLSYYRVVHITKDHFRNYDSVEALFQSMRVALKVRANSTALNKYSEIRHENFKKFFLTSDYSYMTTIENRLRGK